MGSIHEMRSRLGVRWAFRALAGVALLTTAMLDSQSAVARPGTHPIVVSTWDARASSVVLEYRQGLLDGGAMHVVSYHANFSSTGGRLSSQFGLYYLNFSEAADAPTAHGLAGSATAVFSLPVASRYENGLARAAIDLYFGSAPTALISGERNYVSVPFVLGFGVPITPAKAITITPWFELSPSVNLDTVIHPYDFSKEDWTKYVDPLTGQVKLTSDDVERVLRDSVDLEFGFGVGARGGLDITLHASDYFDFDVNASMSSIGTAFSGTRVVYLGGGFIWRWDDIVPAVLPANKRLLHESCEDVETRFRSCPASHNWRSPEELQKFGPTQFNTPAQSPASAPAPIPAPAPTEPVPAAPSAPVSPPAPAAPSAPDAAAPNSAPGAPAPVGGFPTQ